MLDFERGVAFFKNGSKQKGGFMEVEIERMNVTIKLKITPAKKQK